MTDKLTIRWSKREKALVYAGSKPTGGMLALFVEGVKLADVYRTTTPDPNDERTLAQELYARGYDLTTLRFSIRRKATP